MKMVILSVLLLLTACVAQAPATSPGPPTGADTVTFLPDTSSFPNPERGFHDDVSLVELSAGSRIRPNQPDMTLVRSYVRLDEWRHTDLPDWLLDSLQAGFDAVRANGLKIVPRFAYNWGDGGDAPLEQVLRHITQLQPLLERNRDVIAVLQAGFIGKWGEWHGSEYGLTTEANKRRIGQALLTALPPELTVQFRTPYHMYHVLATRDPLTEAAAFTTQAQARSGFLNDCFLAGFNDAGTFDGAEDRNFAAQQARFTVTGGETCDIDLAAERISCNNALSELEQYGWDYLNFGYYRPIIQGWSDQGCLEEVRQRLGYRFHLSGASLLSGDGVAPELRLTISNTGFGKLYNPRPLQVILVNRQTGTEVTHTVSSDARQVLPLAGERDRVIITQLPGGLGPGTWDLFLALPDGHATLAADARYSIRLASTFSDGSSVWVAGSGRNRLGLNLTVPQN